MATSGKRSNSSSKSSGKKSPQRRTNKKTVTKTKFHTIKLIILIIFIVAIVIMGLKVKDKIQFLKNQRGSVFQKINSTVKTQTEQDYEQQAPAAYQKSQEINDDINSIIASGTASISPNSKLNSGSATVGNH